MWIPRRNNPLRDTLALVLAGGRGERLYPLTRDRTKGAVPFGGQFRLIDFTLSNCLNSGLRRICILPQYKSASLERHLQLGWNFMQPSMGERLYTISPQQRIGQDWYKGTADAIYQNIYTLEQEAPFYALVLSSDHIYRMDYSLMLDHHLSTAADLTVACMEVDLVEARRYGVMQIDSSQRIVQFDEKPSHPRPMPEKVDRALASMGIYIFNTDTLVDLLKGDARRRETTHDFGRDIIPRLVQGNAQVQAYNVQRGQAGDNFYWRDIGVLDAYWEASMELLSANPPFNLYSRDWPLHSWHPPLPPARITQSNEVPRIVDSLVCPGAVVTSARVERSILAAGVCAGPGAQVGESVLMEGVSVGEGACVHRAIIDKGVQVPAGFAIGLDPEEDSRRFARTSKGVVVIGKNAQLTAAGRVREPALKDVLAEEDNLVLAGVF